jgi:alkylation response protein AidB-like acyl-CoA dehydrogenase
MLLTESEAGTEVGAITTTARKNDDNTYSIIGNKIFITAGEHDLADNIIHPVLARIEGAPKGSRGISIFIVPKIWVNKDKTLGKHNDIQCVGIEENGIPWICHLRNGSGFKGRMPGISSG